jgi:hypothetical protein
MYAFHTLQRASRLSVGLSRAGKLKPGVRKIRGRVVMLGKSVRSPASRKPCVYYRLRVEEETKKFLSEDLSHQGSRVLWMWFFFGLFGVIFYRMFRDRDGGTKVIYNWRNLLDDSKCTSLAVEDDTGRARIDLTDAEVAIKDKSQMHSDRTNPFPPEFQDLLWDRYDMTIFDEDERVKVMRAVEEVLKEGSKVTVVGEYAADSGLDLCFQSTKDSGPLLVTEFDTVKESRSTRFTGNVAMAATFATLIIGAFALVFGIIALFADV